MSAVINYFESRQEQMERLFPEEPLNTEVPPELVQSAIRSQIDGREYEQVKRMPTGSFSVVTVVRCENKKYALKRPQRENEGAYIRKLSVKGIRNEALILIELNRNDPENRSHIIRLEDVVLAKGDLSLVLEMGGKDLFSFVEDHGRIRLLLLQKITKQVLEALCFLGEHNVVNNDVKNENILWNGERVKLIDFGLAFKGERLQEENIGTMEYRSPEVLLGLMATKAVDVWGLGCALFEGYAGEHVFIWHFGKKGCQGNSILAWRASQRRLIQDYELTLQRRYPEELKRRAPYNIYVAPFQSMESAKRNFIENRMMRTQQVHKDKEEDTQAFWSLIDRMLAFDPQSRITPADALEYVAGMRISDPEERV